MLNVKINNLTFLVHNTLSVLEVCQYVGVHIPRFCYNENLSIAGNCRMCLVEVEKSPKPVVSCALPVSNNLTIYTDSPLVKKARENMLETLLLNHPLDCPICDQGGECDLQDQVKIFGGDYSRFTFNKRGVEDKPYGSFIKTIMTRCIHCTRCVRFSDEITGVASFGTFNRGMNTEIGPYTKDLFNSEISGNIIDLCPVGALTSKPYAFRARPWELKINETIDCTDGFGAPIIINSKESDVVRVQPKIDNEIQNCFISDKIRFSYDSLKKNRIKSVYERLDFQETTKKYAFKVISWEDFFTVLNNILITKKKLNFLINFLDINTIHLLKRFKIYFNKLTLSSFTKNLSNLGLFTFSDSNSVKNIENSNYRICLLISVNLQIESTIINTKLRIKFKKKYIDVLSFGSSFSNKGQKIIVNTSCENLSNLIEAQNSRFNNIIRNPNTLIIFGNSMETRFSNIDQIILFFKQIVPTCIIIKNELKIDSNGLKFLNIDSFNTKRIVNTDFFFCLNVEDNIFSRKILFKKSYHWFHPYGSVLAAKALNILPVSFFFEEKNLYLNLEKNFINSYQIYETLKDSLSIKDFLIGFTRWYCLFNNNNFINLMKSSYYLQFAYSNLSLSKNIGIFENFNFQRVIKMTLKPLIKDFYLDSFYTKNSSFLVERSRELRKTFNNFS